MPSLHAPRVHSDDPPTSTSETPFTKDLVTTIMPHVPTVRRDLRFARGSEEIIRGPPIDVAELARSIAHAIQTTSERDHFATGRRMTIAQSRMLMTRDAKTSIRSDECFACSAQTIASRDQSP